MSGVFFSLYIYACSSYPLSSVKSKIPKITSINLKDLAPATLPLSFSYHTSFTVPQTIWPAWFSLQALGMLLPQYFVLAFLSAWNSLYLTFIAFKSLFEITFSIRLTWLPYWILQAGLPPLPVFLTPFILLYFFQCFIEFCILSSLSYVLCIVCLTFLESKLHESRIFVLFADISEALTKWND